jgi:hypothetical protein
VQTWPDEVIRLLPWVGILLVCLIVGAVVLTWLLRRLRSPQEAPKGLGMTLSQVREMRERGEITPDEFEKLRQIVIAEAKAGPKAAEPPSAANPETKGPSEPPQ